MDLSLVARAASVLPDAALQGSPPPDYALLFRRLPAPFLVLEAGSRFAIVDANQAWLDQHGVNREAILGRGLFDAFPGWLARHGLRRSLEDVLATGAGDGGNSPVYSADGAMIYIIHRGEGPQSRPRFEAGVPIAAAANETGAKPAPAGVRPFRLRWMDVAAVGVGCGLAAGLLLML